MSHRAVIAGVGLIGGSIGMALREQGWHVSGIDEDEKRLDEAKKLEAIDSTGWDEEAEITFVAAPVRDIPALVKEALEVSPKGFVTDVGSVKSSISKAIKDPRFVGGHPMAGSEQEGLIGADSAMFSDANWVLTPTEDTDDEAFKRVREVIVSLGAEIVTLSPSRHDSLVAMVSHVPHLAAATLMGLAANRSEEHFAVLRLAAGGFRDMTRIAAGNPTIWPDICAENHEAITEVIDEFISALTEVRNEVNGGDNESLLQRLETSREARMNLPTGAPRPSELIEVRVPIMDKPGELATIASLATELDVNIFDLEMTHSSEGDRGVVVLLVEKNLAERLSGGLMMHGYRPALRPLL